MKKNKKLKKLKMKVLFLKQDIDYLEDIVNKMKDTQNRNTRNIKNIGLFIGVMLWVAFVVSIVKMAFFS